MLEVEVHGPLRQETVPVRFSTLTVQSKISIRERFDILKIRGI